MGGKVTVLTLLNNNLQIHSAYNLFDLAANGSRQIVGQRRENGDGPSPLR